MKRQIFAAQLVETKGLVIKVPLVDVGGALIVWLDEAARQVFY